MNSKRANVDNFTNVNIILSRRSDIDSFDFTNFNTLNKRRVLNTDKFKLGTLNIVSNISDITSRKEIITITKSNTLK